jgi:hypothetical protein
MQMLLWISLIVALVIGISGFLVRRAGRVILAMPIAVAAIGALWLFGALSHYQRVTGRELQGLVGYHYSMPEWGFKYADGGAQIARWAFHVPAIATLALLLGSAIVASVTQWRNIGIWPTLSLWLYHFGCAAAFFVVYAMLWVEAASVFI